ncbi:MAG: DNA-3-methyladenine glycosylase [Spongiibacteraceae bacterium]|jgi:DNA-3-methyladenine glycosylase|nr:DNA-3-methyladenine glycosylase [Spongiibacteraceae bacterium]
MQPLPRSFYERHPAVVAPALIGKLLVRELDGELLAGRIVEAEAYSSEDPASHSYNGMTERNRAMFGLPGHAYIYFSYGMHHCMNVTSRLDTDAGGVLIRALEPVLGIETMRRLRGREKLTELTSGPGKLAQALAIDRALYGVDITEAGPLFVAEPAEPGTPVQVAATPRIGISKAVELPWRFVEAGSRFISCPPRR